jgi:cytochrome c
MLIALSAAATEQPAESAGKLAFNNHCRTCHSLKQGDHRQGPSLHGIVGAKAGASEYGSYSQGIKNSGLTWDAATLERFIEKPDQVVPSNNMKPYAGMTDAEVRRKIVEFLQSQSKGS